MWKQVQAALNQSATQFITRLAELLPGFVALIVALLVSLVLAWLAAVIVRRLLNSMRFDEHVVRWGFPSDRAPRRSPTALIAGLIGFAIVIAGFLIGLEAFNSDLTSLMVRGAVAYVPNLVGAALVLIVGAFAANYLSRTVLIGAVNLNVEYARLLSAGVKWLVNVLAVAMALEHLEIARRVVELAFGILFGGIVLALALAVGLGSKDLVTKSLERDGKRSSTEAIEEPFRHL